MPAPVVSAYRRLADAVRGFSVGQRTVALIGIAVLVLGVSAFVAWMAKPSYTPLFSGLDGADANAIVEQLRADGVSYELSDGGGTILVPQDAVYDERLKAAAAGLPSSNTGGYALLDQMGVTSSEFQQSVTYKRAMEGELASTISAMKGVRAASVRLAIPEETVFTETKEDPTASVFVETEPSDSLDRDQVQAIVHLTSASIEDMKPDDVAVIDANGTVLSAVGVGALGGADKQASDYEKRVQNAVQTMLDRVVGVGNSTVAVSADMSYESAERTEESFAAADEVPPLRETTSTETYAGGDNDMAAGVLGPDNIAVPEGEADGGTGSYSSESSTKNNAVNKVTEHRVIPAGAIRRQSVSVAVDTGSVEGMSMANIRSLVSSAAGIDTERGDMVTVQGMDFNAANATEAQAALEAAESAAEADRVAGLIRTGIITLGVIILVVLSLFVYARRSKRRRREVLAQWEIEAEAKRELEAAAQQESLESPALPPLLEGSNADSASDAPDPERTRAELSALASRDPEKAANLLRGLMDDRSGV